MRTISIDEAIVLLKNSAAVIVESDPYAPVIYAELPGEDDEDTFLRLAFTGEDCDFDFAFNVSDNEIIEVDDDGLLTFVADDKELVQIRLLEKMKL